MELILLVILLVILLKKTNNSSELIEIKNSLFYIHHTLKDILKELKKLNNEEI